MVVLWKETLVGPHIEAQKDARYGLDVGPVSLLGFEI